MTDDAQEYPNNYLGLNNEQSQHAGAVNQFHAPVKLDTGAIGNNGSNGALGAMLQSGVGVPNCGSPAGGLYFRTDTPTIANQRLYICTTAGVAGAAVWLAIL